MMSDNQEKVLETEDEKPTKEELLAREDDYLRGLLEAASNRESEIVTIEIARKGKVFFKFRVRPLTEKEANDCSDKATKFVVKNGIRIPVSTDSAKFRSLLIYTATVEEDRAKLWDNKKVWESLNVLNGVDVIDKVLHPGEKDAVMKKINEISGYKDEELEELAKN